MKPSRFNSLVTLTVESMMTRDPLSSWRILSLSWTWRPFFIQITRGGGSPPTEQVSTTRSATVTALLPGGERIWGGTEWKACLRLEIVELFLMIKLNKHIINWVWFKTHQYYIMMHTIFEHKPLRIQVSRSYHSINDSHTITKTNWYATCYFIKAWLSQNRVKLHKIT